MTAGSYVIRQAERTEIELMIDWAAREGWNPGLNDADPFHAANPGGFLVGTLDGLPVASISVVAYGPEDGFLGFYIVTPEHREKGFGYRLWQHGIDRLGRRNIGLDGVVQQQDNYRRSGFSLAWNNIRYRGRGTAQVPSGLMAASAVPFDEMLAYDAAHFGCERPSFLRRWIAPPAGLALASIENGSLAGYGVIRACREGHKIGPLFAESPNIADKLFLGLTASVPGEHFYLDIPEPNADARALVQRFGMEPVFETARMYTRGNPGIPLATIFGITSFELG